MATVMRWAVISGNETAAVSPSRASVFLFFLHQWRRFILADETFHNYSICSCFTLEQWFRRMALVCCKRTRREFHLGLDTARITVKVRLTVKECINVYGDFMAGSWHFYFNLKFSGLFLTERCRRCLCECVCVCEWVRGREWEWFYDFTSNYLLIIDSDVWSGPLYYTTGADICDLHLHFHSVWQSQSAACVCASRFHLCVRWGRVLLISRTARCVVNGFPVQSILVSCPFPVASTCGYLWVSLHIIHTKVSVGWRTFSFQFWGLSESIFTIPAPLDWAWLTVCHISRDRSNKNLEGLYLLPWISKGHCSGFLRTI